MVVVSSLIHCVEQFLLTGLISLAIVFATMRAYIAKILVSMEAAGFSTFFICTLLGLLSVYGCIAAVRCYAWCQPDEEQGMIDEDLAPNSRYTKTPIFFTVDGGRCLKFDEKSKCDIKLVDGLSGKLLFPGLSPRPTLLTYPDRCAFTEKSIDGHPPVPCPINRG